MKKEEIKILIDLVEKDLNSNLIEKSKIRDEAQKFNIIGYVPFWVEGAKDLKDVAQDLDNKISALQSILPQLQNAYNKV